MSTWLTVHYVTDPKDNFNYDVTLSFSPAKKLYEFKKNISIFLPQKGSSSTIMFFLSKHYLFIATGSFRTMQFGINICLVNVIC